MKMWERGFSYKMLVRRFPAVGFSELNAFRRDWGVFVFQLVHYHFQTVGLFSNVFCALKFKPSLHFYTLISFYGLSVSRAPSFLSIVVHLK